CEELCRAREAAGACCELRFRGLLGRLVEWVRAEAPRRRAARSLLSFDDLLSRVEGALRGPGGGLLGRRLRERFRAVLVDEFQDTDPLQYAIFRKAFGGGGTRLVLVGDPKQAIYRFRGADIFAYRQAAADAGDRTATLRTNWRAAGGLVQAVNALFARREAPFLFDWINFRPARPRPSPPPGLEAAGDGGAALHLWIAGADCDGAALLEAMAAAVVRLLEAGRAGRARIGERPVGPGDVAVLVATNAQAARMHAFLRRRGVPAVLASRESVFASREAEELYRVLAAAAAPARPDRLKGALATDLLGLTGAELADLPEEGLAEWMDRLARCHDVWRGRGVMAGARALAAEAGVVPRLLRLEDGPRRVTNLFHCLELLHRAESEEDLGPEGLLQWLGARILDPPGGEEAVLRPETEDRALRILTIHRAKGLEFPVVFLPYLPPGPRREEARFPLCHGPGGERVLELRPEHEEAAQAAWEREELAEELRRFYVAVTRAGARCHVAWRPGSRSALDYLLDVPGGEGGEAAARGALEELARASGGAVAWGPLPAPGGECFRPPVCVPAEPSCRSFSRRFPPRRVLSFTSLVAARPAPEGPAWDEPGDGAPEASSPAPGDHVRGFPRGTRAGICLHAVMERADYAAGGAGAA
ncbi:UvrD-helicase domain-containing protein, partial [Dissulfurirhabdus thermomarina]